MLTARQKLAQSLSFRLKERKIPASYVASRCRVPVADVLRWLDGSLVPNSGEWADLHKYVLRNVVHDSLWQDAKSEQDDEHRRKLRSLDKASPGERPDNVSTNIGDKLREAGITEPPVAAKPLPPPQVEFAMTRPTRPSYRKSSREERRRYAKGILLQRPGIRVGGDDGLQVLIRQRYGIGIDPKIVSDIRREIENEHKHPGASIRAPEAPSAVSVALPVTAQEPSPNDLSAGVELILGAMPSLQQLVITVQDNGEVFVEYKIRKIEIQTIGGSITIRPK